MQYENITTDRQFVDFCNSIADAPAIAFDTEFVSEDSYRSDLCLLQVAVDERLAIVDTKTVEDLAPFWTLLATPGRQTIVHAGREEILFSQRAIGSTPHDLFDVQLAAGMIGLEFPASYGTLISKLLDETLAKGETRTNWRHRPLSDRQLQYALQDIVYLFALREKLQARLEELGRAGWFAEEVAAWQQNVVAVDREPRWQRISGTAGFSRRKLAVVRELWQWREAEAERRDRPARRVLRDDLIAELARRGTADVKRIHALRGLERGDLKRQLPHIAECIQRALDLPDDQLPIRTARHSVPQTQFTLLVQFLATALGSICRQAQIAPTLVGTVQDLRDLVAYRLNTKRGSTDPPALATGWRAEIVGQQIDHLLAGDLAIFVADPHGEQPLKFESR